MICDFPRAVKQPPGAFVFLPWGKRFRKKFNEEAARPGPQSAPLLRGLGWTANHAPGGVMQGRKKSPLESL